MSLRDRLSADMKATLRAGDKSKLAAIRLIQAAIQAKDLELGQAAFAKAGDAQGEGGGAGSAKARAGEDEVMAVLQKMIKQRQDSVAAFEKGGRAELAEAETNEIAVIASYLPAPLTEEETNDAIEAAIRDTGASGMKDMGRVIGELRSKFGGRMDFGRASGLVKARLG